MSESDQRKAPERRWVITARVGGDTIEDALHLLKAFIFDIERGSRGPIISGSPSSGGSLEVKENPEMTHEEFLRQLYAYLEKPGSTQKA